MTPRCLLSSFGVVAVLLGGFGSGAVAVAAAQEAGPVEFHRDIRPILAESCLVCHGPNDAIRQADLRFDTDEFLERLVVPGDAESSLLYERLTTEDPIRRMPPAGLPLTDDQIDLVRRWIDGGAAWGDALAAADAPALPERTIDFAREVRPILSENCFTCHGPDAEARQRGLRLDVAEGPFSDRGSFGGPVIVPGNSRRQPADPPRERRRRPGADALPAGPEHAGHAGHRRGRPRSGRDRDAAPVDRPGGRVAVALGVHPARAPGGAPGGRRGVGSATRSTTSSSRGSRRKAGNRLPRPTCSR